MAERSQGLQDLNAWRDNLADDNAWREDLAHYLATSSLSDGVQKIDADLCYSEPSEVNYPTEYDFGSRPNTGLAGPAPGSANPHLWGEGTPTLPSSRQRPGAGGGAGDKVWPPLPELAVGSAPLPIRVLRHVLHTGFCSRRERGNVALLSRKGEVGARVGLVMSQQQEIARLKELLAVKDDQVRYTRRENAAMWKQRWKRLEEVAEENRELRERGPTKTEEEEQAEQERLAKPSFKDLPKPQISEEEVDEHLDTIARLNDSSIDKLVSPEICELKAAYAQFVTSWQSAVEVLPDEDVSLKLRLIGLAQSPTTWSAKSWCEAAVHAVAPTHDKEEEDSWP